VQISGERLFIFRCIAFLLLAGGAVSPLHAADCDEQAARLVSVEGRVEVQRLQSGVWEQAHLDDVVCLGERVRARAYSRAALLLPNQTQLRLDENTTLTFAPPQDEKKTWLEIFEGLIHVIVRDPHALRVITPFANAAVEGTEFTVAVVDEQTSLTVLEGTVAVENDAGRALVNKNQAASMQDGQLPVARVEVSPLDAVQWALYVPPLFGEAVAPDAEDVAEDTNFYLQRAASRLSVGRFAAARSDIARADALQPDSADALALRATIAVAQNDTQAAVELAQQAQKANAESAAAALALAYARRAQFDLDGARQSLQQGLQANPDSALLLANLAEVQLALGERDAALVAAQQAVTLEPELSLTQSVLGFSYLAQVQLSDARTAFDRSLRLDESNPLPRLGLGLALIRGGELAAGREHIETAVLLDPNNSLLRSYMGKAYYEEKRISKAGPQFSFAKTFDPNDPTPWFYDSILLYTTSRPVAALHGLQQSIALNDNRAVSRSRLLLDEDLAARGASLGRVYQTLGFEQGALVEGWKAVNTDPGDFSGHRLLADLYFTQPRFQLARVDEQFQAQLLQPVSTTPVKPQLGNVNQLFLNDFGPTPGINEFGALFVQNGLGFEGTAVAGGNDTYGGDGVLYGVHDNLSFSLGGFKYASDGFHAANQQDQTILNAYVQYRPGYATSVQAEVRSSRLEYGDLFLRFEPDNFFANQDRREDVDSLRLGFKHDISARSTILGSFFYQDSSVVWADGSRVPEFPEVLDFDQDSYLAELVHQYSGQGWRLTSGAAYKRNDENEVNTTVSGSPIESATQRNEQTSDLKAYTYGQAEMGEVLTLVLGAAVNMQNGRFENETQLSPKLGVIWEPAQDTTLRAAAFRTLQRPFLTRQTILPSLEPTQVAGFNQLYFGATTEDAWNYGAAVDQRVGANMRLGIEYLQRDIEKPLSGGETQDIEEKTLRFYDYWTLGERTALALEYRYEDVWDERAFSDRLVQELETHRVPLEVSYFHPAGLSGGIRGTWVDQKAVYRDINAGLALVPGEDDFWVFDGYIGYRLPRRLGELTLNIYNLFDEEFMFQDTDPSMPGILPERWVLGKLTLAF